MIRTRDFFLYVATVVFLLAGIGVTVISDKSRQVLESFSPIDFMEANVPTSAILTSGENDREANLARLKSKIAAGEGVVISAPPVFTSVDSNPSTTEPTLGEGRATPLTCASWSSQSDAVVNWPQSGVKIKEVEGARLVYTEVINGTTTEEKVLLQLPVRQVRSAGDSCIDGPYIGVTLAGELIGNDDAAKFINSSETVHLGYALDGFPIYGRKTSATDLDSCGGAATSLGYRYYLRANDNFILGCFAGLPAAL